MVSPVSAMTTAGRSGASAACAPGYMARTVTSGSSGRGTAVEGIGLDDGRCAAGGLTPRGRSVTMTVVRATAVEVPTRVLVFGMLRPDGTVRSADLYEMASACDLTTEQ